MDAAHELAPPSRPSARLVLAGVIVLLGLSVATLDMKWASFTEPGAVAKMVEFAGGFFPPETSPAFLRKLATASLETVAMSAVGTLLAVIVSLGLAIAAALPAGGATGPLRSTTRLILNVLRSIPELVWAALWVIAAGLGPFPGTLALAAHTTGVLGRLFADTLENIPQAPARVLRENGASPGGAFLYATLPLATPQLLSYTLYRWENNIRAAAVLGVVGAGGLGQMLYFHLSLFQMHEVASVVLAMLAIVALVDLLSYLARRRLTR